MNGGLNVQRSAGSKCSAGDEGIARWLGWPWGLVFGGAFGFGVAFGPLGGVLEAVALAVGFEDVAAVSEAIEGGAGEVTSNSSSAPSLPVGT